MITVLIPIFNEQSNILVLCEQLITVMNKIEQGFEIIFIDDGSTDRSFHDLDSIAKADDRIKIIYLSRNFGQTAALMAGIDHAKGDIIVPIDGDLQNDPRDIPSLISKLEEGYDVCSGWRKDRKDNQYSRLLPSRIANWIISLVTGVHLHDYGCSLKAYRKEIIKNIKLYGEMHRFVPIFANWQGARVAEVMVHHNPRIYGKSKYNLNRTFKVLLDLIFVKFYLKYHSRPVHFFGGFGLINFLFAGCTVLVMVYLKYFGGKSFVETPLPTLFTLLVLVGCQSILMGLLAEIQMRTYYESQGKKPYVISRTVNFQE